MDCDVCIGISDYDPPEFCSESTPVARRPQKCGECGSNIPVGTRYFKAVGKWDGRLETFRQCMNCREIQEVFSCGEGYVFGGLWETWDDANAFDALTVHSPCFQKLSPETRRFLVDRWWKWKERTRK